MDPETVKRFLASKRAGGFGAATAPAPPSPQLVVEAAARLLHRGHAFGDDGACCSHCMMAAKILQQSGLLVDRLPPGPLPTAADGCMRDVAL